jgi:hypothetical protein
MDNIKLPIALVLAMAAQLAGGVWWVSQQSATINSLEETVSQLGSKMAIEENVNLRRDVEDALDELEHVWVELEEMWEDNASLVNRISHITKLQQRVALLESEVRFMSRDYNNVMGK